MADKNSGIYYEIYFGSSAMLYVFIISDKALYIMLSVLGAEIFIQKQLQLKMNRDYSVVKGQVY